LIWDPSGGIFAVLVAASTSWAGRALFSTTHPRPQEESEKQGKKQSQKQKNYRYWVSRKLLSSSASSAAGFLNKKFPKD
jgi:hypothetical protein